MIEEVEKLKVENADLPFENGYKLGDALKKADAAAKASRPESGVTDGHRLVGKLPGERRRRSRTEACSTSSRVE